jgi:hypothetical protein
MELLEFLIRNIQLGCPPPADLPVMIAALAVMMTACGVLLRQNCIGTPAGVRPSRTCFTTNRFQLECRLHHRRLGEDASHLRDS